jgi:hypothetical protein
MKTSLFLCSCRRYQIANSIYLLSRRKMTLKVPARSRGFFYGWPMKYANVPIVWRADTVIIVTSPAINAGKEIFFFLFFYWKTRVPGLAFFGQGKKRGNGPNCQKISSRPTHYHSLTHYRAASTRACALERGLQAYMQAHARRTDAQTRTRPLTRRHKTK